MNSFWDTTRTCLQCVPTVWLLSGNSYKQKHQRPGCDNWGKPSQAHSPRLGLGYRRIGVCTLYPADPHCSPALLLPAPRRPGYSQLWSHTEPASARSWWSERRPPAWPEQMGASWTGHQAVAQVAAASGPPQETQREGTADPRHGSSRENTPWALKRKINIWMTGYNSGVSGPRNPTSRQAPPQEQRGGVGGYTIERSGRGSQNLRAAEGGRRRRHLWWGQRESRRRR